MTNSRIEFKFQSNFFFRFSSVRFRGSILFSLLHLELSCLPFRQLHAGGFHIHRFGLEHMDPSPERMNFVVEVFYRSPVLVETNRQPVDLRIDGLDPWDLRDFREHFL